MKRILFSVFALSITFTILSAHEEPAKTINEKQAKEQVLSVSENRANPF